MHSQFRLTVISSASAAGKMKSQAMGVTHCLASASKSLRLTAFGSTAGDAARLAREERRAFCFGMAAGIVPNMFHADMPSGELITPQVLPVDVEEIGRVRHDGLVQTRNRMNGFDGLHVLVLESRRAQEMAKLIVNYGGESMVAPSMREVPLESNTEAQAFARTLAEGGFVVVIFLTGVGTRALARVVETVYPVEQFVAALRKIAVVARGPKPLAVLKEFGVPVILAVPEPNTWREVLRSLDEKIDSLPLGTTEWPSRNTAFRTSELLAGLSERGAQVTSVPVYEWGLPEDLEPLRSAVAAMARGEIDVVMFTSAMQVTHMFQIAAEMKLEEAVRRAFPRMLIASIGPVTSEERLREHGVAADLEPSHPKMGFLVSETAERSAAILKQKRNPER